MRLLLIVLLLITLCSCSAYAGTTDWLFNLSYSALVGTEPGASNDFDGQDAPLPQIDPINIAIYHEQGVDGWTGDTGFYTKDVRETFPVIPGYGQSWKIYVWGDPSLRPTATRIDLTCFFSPAPYDSVEYRLTYVRSAVGVVDGWNTVGESVVLNNYVDAYSVQLPVYRTTNGLDGYIFDLTATVVPEPSALLVLGAGIVGVVMRRRRR